MTTKESNPKTNHQTLTAEDIGRRFLKVIEALKARDDLNLALVQAATELHLVLSSDGRLYGYEQDIADGWRAVLNFRLATASTKAGVDLHYLNDSRQFSDMSPVCAFNFDHFHNALKAMGFRDVPIYGEIGELRSWRYYKDEITLSLIPQDVELGEGGRLCVKSIGTLN